MIHLIRAVKYFLSICVLSAVLIAGLYTFGMAAGTPADLMQILFYTSKGWIFLGAVAVLSLLYPRMGFMTAQVAGKIDGNREQLTEAFLTEGFELTDETQGVLTFRARSAGRRILLRFDDKVTVRQAGPWIEMEGARKIVARVQYRLESYIRRNNE